MKSIRRLLLLIMIVVFTWGCENSTDVEQNGDISSAPEHTGQAKNRNPIWRDATTGMVFVRVAKGCYQMGRESGDEEEQPVHQVCLDEFWIGKYEVTQDQWTKVMGSNPSHYKDCGGDCPVESISWADVQAFIDEINRLSDNRFALPTEAQWEYACRSGGGDEEFSGSDSVGDVGWYLKNSKEKTYPVGSKVANRLGIYDMSGNVFEWVQDIFSKHGYQNHTPNNPVITQWGSYTVVRGGGVLSMPNYLRCSHRHAYGRTGSGSKTSGLRLVRN